MSSTHNHCFSHHHNEAWCHQIFFVNNTKIFVTPSVLKIQKWFLHQNGIESNQKSKSDMCKLVVPGGAGATKRCAQDGFWPDISDIAYWLLDIVADCAMYQYLWDTLHWLDTVSNGLDICSQSPETWDKLYKIENKYVATPPLTPLSSLWIIKLV